MCACFWRDSVVISARDTLFSKGGAVTMSDEQKIKSLEDRLKKARAGMEPDDVEPKSSAMGLAMKLGVELVVGVVVGAFIGYHIDGALDTKPFAMIILSVLGFGSGIRNVIKTATEMNKDAE